MAYKISESPFFGLDPCPLPPLPPRGGTPASLPWRGCLSSSPLCFLVTCPWPRACRAPPPPIPGACKVMRLIFALFVAVAVAAPAAGFTSLPSPGSGVVSRTGVVRMGYVPDGLSKEEWEKIKKKERATKTGLGRVGARGFKSRSMQSFQEALELGEAKHLMPVDPRLVKAGKIKPEDVPYMQRGGNWDNSDIKGAKRKRWLKSDTNYEKRDKTSQLANLFGGGSDIPWTSSFQAMSSTSKSSPGRGNTQRRESRPSTTAKPKPARGSTGDNNPFAKFFGKK